jgi:hypothetical protein
LALTKKKKKVFDRWSLPIRTSGFVPDHKLNCDFKNHIIFGGDTRVTKRDF